VPLSVTAGIPKTPSTFRVAITAPVETRTAVTFVDAPERAVV
jgi:hypothetical protein